MLKVGRKTIITLQEGGVWNEKWPAESGDPWPLGATTYTEFYDSSGAVLLSVPGTVDKQYLTYQQLPAVMHPVPNGAGFSVFCVDAVGPHMVRYGTVFRRQNFFPDSPSSMVTNIPHTFADDFQRPPGAPGGRWKTLVGQPYIFANPTTPPAAVLPHTVGAQNNFYPRYFMRYYTPFSGDAIALSIQCLKKGSSGKTVVAVSCSSDGTAYLYAIFDAAANTVGLGIGSLPDISIAGALSPQVTPVALTVPTTTVGTYQLRYNDLTKEFAFYNADLTTKYVSWVDSGDLAPHGRGYQYFGIGGSSSGSLLGGLFGFGDAGGIQVGPIRAQDTV